MKNFLSLLHSSGDLKNCESEFSYVLPGDFNMCLKESCFTECWKVSILRMAVRGLRLKTNKLINGLVDNLENFSLLSDFKYGFGSSRWTADLLTVEYDRNAWACKRSGANDLSDDVICNIVISVDDTTFYCTHNQAPDLWYQLELAFQLESDLWDSVDWARKWLVDNDAEKSQLV